jgi:hypothetical protein
MAGGKQGKGQSSNGNSSENTKTTAGAGTTAEAGTTAGATTGAETTGNNINEILKVNLVEVEDLEVPEPKKKRGRPTGWRKDSSSNNSKSQKLNVDDIKPILSGLFGIVAMKAGEHWNITDAEAEKVAKPLCNIAEKLNISDKISNASDGTALIIAMITITAPRLLINSATAKQKKKEKVLMEQGGNKKGEGVIQNDKSGNLKEDIKRNNKPDRNTSSDGEFIKAVSIATSQQY